MKWPCQGVREGCQEGCGCKVLQEQKKRNATQDCKNCRESDGLEGHCFEGYCFENPREGRRENRSAQARCPEGCGKTRRRRAARGREEGADPAPRLQDQRIRGLSC